VSEASILDGSPYQAYLYAYPHKTAYRPLEPALPLEMVWAGEAKGALFLYAHVPFCEMRCGFCNLFTASRPADDQVGRWLAAIERQAMAVRRALGGEARFARVALGGGTPTLLDVPRMARLFDVVQRTMGADVAAVPTSVEVSPETITREKLALLRERGVDRISIGVQSFLDDESRAAGRPQQRAVVDAALEAIALHAFPVLNVDLIYGIEGQTEATFLESLRAALRFEPREIYLYPLYVRPLTGLGRRSRSWDDHRLSLYRVGRDYLRAEGFSQASMRMFQRGGATDGPVYCVQDDGMVGLGVGARSYTRSLHYASDYAVSARAVGAIVDRWTARTSFDVADHGFRLDDDERRRRWVLLSLLGDGLDRDAYQARFGGDVHEHLPELDELRTRAFTREDGARLVLTDAGVERSDAIGPHLVSPAVRARMADYELR
jgi:oxygen-independent coproporphyrinogen-3 oxidase